ncbi:MAG: FAD linked oxidase domain protein [Desulfonauticus sp. 38_4375]|jgi:FAD/FMN-containing dehydrogenase/Fe-S oxidoreductase|nr:MAG: FAD linked oxidase domain protein [Desulfonauticus sp. 38_4375]
MSQRKPHISLASERLIKRVLKLNLNQFRAWPESVQNLALSLAAEIFIIRYNPFIKPQLVRQSVFSRLKGERTSLSEEYYEIISTCLENYWKEFEQDEAFKQKVVKRLKQFMEEEQISLEPNAIAECSTDATDLRMELPLMVLFPESTTQIRKIIELANELHFSLIPRGGGSGLTGGAVPAGRRSVILSLSRLKKILKIDPDNLYLCVQAGVITLDAIKAAARYNLLLTVDPASKAASSLGGNVAENAGGPYAFEYGTTLDNILSYKMILPTGELIEVKRKNHPRHKILPQETATFEIYNEQGKLKEVIRLKGEEIRKAGLGKDVTNKYLGGLPGIQKEGVDGIITEICFILHPKPALSRTLCLEFYGKSMRNAALVINDIVKLRDTIRTQGDLVKISALEEFGIKYVQAIEYQKKSTRYEGEPISVLLLQLDSDDLEALEDAVHKIVELTSPYEGVDIFVARDEKEAEIFWEDRHKLSAITKRTSGFKINEDVVIPLEAVPAFSDFLENLNLYYLAKAYRKALQKVQNLPGIDIEDEFIHMELDIASKILKNKINKDQLSEQELQVQIGFFFQDLKSRYSALKVDLDNILNELFLTRIEIANHMHAGDGNCHVNIPVNSNDLEMLAQAEEATEKIFAKVLELGGQISGEHGIGVTKINFLETEKIKALREYKSIVDPNDIFNPKKLIQKELPVEPYTFSFNHLIQDIKGSALKESEKQELITLLKNIQICSRCGKCKQVCPMYLPEKGLLFHPRNKNITLGALIEAIYYTQLLTGEPDQELLHRLRKIMEHCTACGKCTFVCPVKIKNAEVALMLRNFLEGRESSGHPIKHKILNLISQNPEEYIPKSAKFVSIGQRIQNKIIPFVPEVWRKKINNPLFKEKGPETEFLNLYETIDTSKYFIFTPKEYSTTVFYFPGCGASVFYRSIGLASIYLLLKSKVKVVIPPKHLCCGYPLLVSGAQNAYSKIRESNITLIEKIISQKENQDLNFFLTSCGTCREATQNYNLKINNQSITHLDVVQFILNHLPELCSIPQDKIIYHPACHSEWVGVNPVKSPEVYAKNISSYLKTPVQITPGCCGESGLGALTSPEIYNKIRERKLENLKKDLKDYPTHLPIIVGCPSCKIGIKRALNILKYKYSVLHTVEYLSMCIGGPKWKNDFIKKIKKSKKENNKIILDI